MSDRLRWPIALVIVGGLAIGLWTVGRVGLVALAEAALRVGPGGFAIVCAISVVILLLLGAAWAAAMPSAGFRRMPLFAWARATREASSDMLPFSQLGGIVVGARTLTVGGLPAVPVFAAMIVDMTAEMAGQIVVTLYGLWVLAETLIGGGEVGTAAWAGAGMAVATLAAFVVFQRPLLALVGRFADRLLPDAQLPFVAIRAELDRLYADRRPVALSFALNLMAWLVSALLAWVTLRLMGAEVSVGRAVALESLIFAVRSAAFLIPGAIGVQEAAYLVLAQAFGIDPQAAVALSLVKRARDVAIGVPTLIAWQAWEWRTTRNATA